MNCCITFCLSEVNNKFNSSGLPISSANVYKNHTQESLFSCSTTCNATGKIFSFPSLAIDDNICPPNLPFNWQLSNPTSDLHPSKNPTFYALYLTYILLKLGCVLGSVISVCRITLLPISVTLIIFA